MMNQEQNNDKPHEQKEPNRELNDEKENISQAPPDNQAEKKPDQSQSGVNLSIGGSVTGPVAAGEDVVQIGAVTGGMVNIGPQTNYSQASPTAASPEKQPLEIDPRLRQLLDVLDSRFNTSEIRDICFALGVDYDNLQGETKRGKAQSLIEYHQHRDQISGLESEVSRRRPATLD
jgi:hypothetical protein